LGSPLFLLNLKAYPSGLGAGALRLARTLGDAGRAAGVAVAIAPAAPYLSEVATDVRYPVLAQHVDPLGAGPCTGFVPPAAILAARARGSLVNHSEHSLSPSAIRDAVHILHELELVAVVCAGTVAAAGRLARTRPEYLAIEPPELIGGTRAVSTARPEVVEGAVRAVHRAARSTRVLCGAGVHDRHDIAKALELGSEGVLVSSAVARAPSPRAAIEELLSGF